VGSGTGVAAHPIAQLKQEDNTVQLSLQSTHRSHHSRTHSFHTIYDGEGRRVKKISSTETTVFVYNASGQLVAEYSTALASTPQVSYLTTDHLGSPRVITNENGTVKDRKDYSAFGEESTSAQRSANSEYSAADQLRKNYTGYEKDGESGLEFAQARYYNPTHGRFTSVDPLTASASIRNPQTFNRYSYVLNSPYKFNDPLGLLSSSTGACGQWCPGSDAGVESFSGHDDVSDSFLPQQDKTPKKAKPKPTPKRKSDPKKQTQRKKQPPPPPAKKDGPKPASATVTPELVGPNAEEVAPGVFKVGSMATFIVSVVGDDGKPFEGTISETVESTVNGVKVGTITAPETPLVNGQFVDIAAPAGIATGNRAPTDAEIEAISKPMEEQKTRLEQTATFTVRSTTTNATLTIVHKRTLSNVDGAGNLRAVRNGTRFVLYPPQTTVTQNSP